MQSQGNRIWLLRAELKHKLSMLSLGDMKSLRRYTTMLESERRFYCEIERPADLLWYRLRMLRRIFANMLRIRDKRVALLEIRSLLGLRL